MTSYWDRVDPEQEYFREKELVPWMKRMEEKLDKLMSEEVECSIECEEVCNTLGYCPYIEEDEK